MKGWQNIAGDANRLYPDKSEDWRCGYYAGCHNAGTAKPDDLMPLSTLQPKDYRAGFAQAALDVSLNRPALKTTKAQTDGEPV